MLTEVTAIILAGGKGTRIRSLYPDVPKPMIPIRNKPFLYWVTVFLARAGVSHFVYSTGYFGDQIAAWARDDNLPGIVRSTVHENEPLGTGGGLINCLQAVNSEWVLVANGDSLCLSGMDALLAITRRDNVVGGLIGVHIDDTSRYGSLDLTAQGRLTAFREKAPGRGHINAGTYLFRKDALMALGRRGACSIEQDVFPELIARGGHLQAVLVRDAPFIDIGTPETVAQADAFISANASSFAWPA